MQLKKAFNWNKTPKFRFNLKGLNQFKYKFKHLIKIGAQYSKD